MVNRFRCRWTIMLQGWYYQKYHLVLITYKTFPIDLKSMFEILSKVLKQVVIRIVNCTSPKQYIKLCHVICHISYIVSWSFQILTFRFLFINKRNYNKQIPSRYFLRIEIINNILFFFLTSDNHLFSSFLIYGGGTDRSVGAVTGSEKYWGIAKWKGTGFWPLHSLVRFQLPQLKAYSAIHIYIVGDISSVGRAPDF